MTRSRRRAAGFTLLELLVAMTVLGVLTGLLASGLSFGTRIWEREQKQLEQWAELQMVQDIVRRTLGAAWPLNVPASAGPEGAAEGIAFVGTDTEIEFVGPAPAQSLSGGIYQYGLISRTGPGGVSLVLTWRPRGPEATQQKGKGRGARARPNETSARARRNETAEGKEVVLLDRLVNAEFSYFGGSDEDVKPRWRDRWHDPSKLPLLVRVLVAFPPGDRRRWPELVIAPAITGTIGEG
jgi:general secretion pathway protein J